MKEIRCLGVFREDDHSPDRVSDDHAILTESASAISRHSAFSVTLAAPHELKAGIMQEIVPDVIFYMCEETEQLEIISASNAMLVVNPVEGVKNTFRKEMCSMFAREDYFPESMMLRVSLLEEIPPDMQQNVWVKRGDYHAVALEDVQFASNPYIFASILDDFSRRGIKSVMIQRHVDGDLVKFYGIADKWFKWFYHREQQLNEYDFDTDRLESVCRHAAAVTGLEIYGGDVIISQDGAIHVIDINAWPSFALFRKEAAIHIASHITSMAQDKLLQAGLR